MVNSADFIAVSSRNGESEKRGRPRKKTAQGHDEGDNGIVIPVIPPIVGLGSTPSSYLMMVYSLDQALDIGLRPGASIDM